MLAKASVLTALDLSGSYKSFFLVLSSLGLGLQLIVLNLTISMGTINGSLFFTNVVKTYNPVIFGKNILEALLYFLSWLNIDLGISPASLMEMNACHNVRLQFLFPMYLLFLVLAIVAICRCGQWKAFRSMLWVVV